MRREGVVDGAVLVASPKDRRLSPAFKENFKAESAEIPYLMGQSRDKLQTVW
jgi:hypothetical protein